MLVAKYAGRKAVRIVEQPSPPPPSPGEVQLEVSYVGICGTDLHILHGAMDGRVSMPLAFGHEVSGTVTAVGAGVAGWAPGDQACIFPLLPDGSCDACIRGFGHICVNLDFIGIDSPGGLQQLWNVPEGTLVRVPDSIDLRDAALIEPVAVAVHDVRRAGVSAGASVVVLGGGPIGVLIASVARSIGARVAVAELEPSRRQTIVDLGLNAAAAGDDLPSWVNEWTGGAGADFVFEVSGSAGGVLQSASLARVRGTVVIVAIHPRPREVDLHRVFWRELTVIGTRVYERDDFDRAIELMDEGAIPTEVITHVFPLHQIGDALDTLESGAAMKVLVAVAGKES